MWLLNYAISPFHLSEREKDKEGGRGKEPECSVHSSRLTVASSLHRHKKSTAKSSTTSGTFLHPVTGYANEVQKKKRIRKN